MARYIDKIQVCVAQYEDGRLAVESPPGTWTYHTDHDINNGTYRVTLWSFAEGLPVANLGHVDFNLSGIASDGVGVAIELSCGTSLPVADEGGDYCLIFDATSVNTNRLRIVGSYYYENNLAELPTGWAFADGWVESGSTVWTDMSVLPPQIGFTVDGVSQGNTVGVEDDSGPHYASRSDGLLATPPVAEWEEIYMFSFTIAEGGIEYLVTPATPTAEAVGEKIIANGLTWECVDADVVFDVLFREFGTTAFTVLAENITDLLFAIPYNLTYNQIYFWIINEYTVDPGTGDRTLVSTTGEQFFTTEALIEYPRPSTRTVPDGLTPPGVMTVTTGDNCVAAIRRIVVACNDEIWYEAIE